MSRHVPFDLLCKEIFPRLPAKSVGRFMCLSKSWNSVLKSTEFATEQLPHATKKLLVISEKTSRNFLTTRFHTLDYEAKTDHGAVSKLGFPLGDVYAVVLGSCNGIVCVAINSPQLPKSEFIEELGLWNPLTGDYKKIPSLSPAPDHIWYRQPCSLCYDESDKDYKIVTVNKEGYGNMFTLNSNSWKALGWVGACSVIERGVFFNGKLYWGIYGVSLPSRTILCFDLKTEKFTRMSLPLVGKRRVLYLAVYQECLHVFVSYDEGKEDLEVWRMNERKEQVWERTPAIISPGNWGCCNWLIPICFTTNGEVIVFLVDSKDHDQEYKIVTYSPANCKVGHNFKITDRIREDSDEKIMVITYMETLVSPNDIG